MKKSRYVWSVRILLLLLTLTPFEGEAALYCVADFSGERCLFSDRASCQKAAGEQGSCFLNRKQLRAPTGGSPFCLVESWHTECIYRDMPSCALIAAPRQASCIANPNLTGDPVPDMPPLLEHTDPKKPPEYLPSPGYQPIPGRR